MDQLDQIIAWVEQLIADWPNAVDRPQMTSEEPTAENHAIRRSRDERQARIWR